MARRKRPAARGIAMSVATLMAPADSPKIVTLCGSPPKSGDVLLDPGECSDLVEQAEVDNAVTQIEEAIGSQTIVDGDADEAIAGEMSATIGWHGPRSFGEA